jgi:tetratricopeptide (TPR) repeat protein/cold shock CspA family protein
MTEPAVLLAEVGALAKRGNYHAIVARYGALDEDTNSPAWSNLELVQEIGRAFGMLGNEDKAELYLLRCAELAPRRAAVFHCAIGWYYQRKKKWTKALRWYDRALAAFPTYHLCLFRRGYCLEKLHRPREAMETLARARVVWEQAPEQRLRGRGVQVQVLFHLSRGLRDLGHFDAAAEALETCWALDREGNPPAIRPEHVFACRGELQMRRGNLADARADFEEARDIDPTSSYVWERLGRVHELAGDHVAAEEAYRRAVALPRGGFALLALGRFHLHVTHDLVASAEALVEALERRHAAEPLVRLELARLHLTCNRPAAALAHIERALAYRSEGAFIDGLKLGADLAERLGRVDQAVRYLNQLARLAPDDPTLAARAQALADTAPPPALPIDPPLPPELAVLDGVTPDSNGPARVPGIVDRFFADKGFGFLRYGEGQSIFFHVTQCEDGGAHTAPGMQVSFVVGHNPKKGKPQAEDVRSLA